MTSFAIDTKVAGDALQVFNSFDQKLFAFLAPPIWLAKIQLFEGSKIGDKVIVKFKVPFSALMQVIITEESSDAQSFWFIDEGQQLPFGLTSWRHKHQVISDGFCSIIRDDITFNTNNKLKTFVYKPILYFMFYMRKPLYKKFFGTCK